LEFGLKPLFRFYCYYFLLLVNILCYRDYIPAESLSATCPVCRRPSILPRDDAVAGLQDNAFIISLMNAIDKLTLCAWCEKVGDVCFAVQIALQRI